MSIEQIVLDKKEIELFLQKIEVRKDTCPLKQLQSIIKGILSRIAFNNLFLLASQGIKPQSKDIIDLMLTAQGGLCDVMNPFLYVLLKSIGYDVSFMSASMAQPNCHIILKVSIKESMYLVDVGNGFPYFEPIALNEGKTRVNQVFLHSVQKHKIQHINGTYFMLHKIRGSNIWQKNYSFNDADVSFSSFDNMLTKQYTEIGWGPFLTTIQAKKWTGSGGLILRNDFFWDSEKNMKKRLSNPEDLKHCLENHFQINMNLSVLRDIWNICRENKGQL